MFIPLHVITVVSVVFLVVLVMFAWRNRSRGHDLVRPRVVEMPVALPPEVEREVRVLLDRGAKIEAVKLIRSETDLDLKDAKELVERMAQEW